MAGIIARKPEGDFKIPDPGTYIARCIWMFEIGTITVNFGNNTSKLHKVRITWELPEEKAVFNDDRGPEPFVVSKEYNLSTHAKSTLRKDLESWRGAKYTEEESKEIDVTKLLGHPCMITIIHEEQKNDPSKINANVSSIGKLPKGLTCPPQINETKLLCFSSFDWELFSSLPDWLKDKIRTSEEYKALAKNHPNADPAFGQAQNQSSTGAPKQEFSNQSSSDQAQAFEGKSPDDLPF